MRIFVFFVILTVVLVCGCTSTTDCSSLSYLRNSTLNYSCDFNETLCNDCGGHTYNSTYFQLKKYAFWQEPFQTIPYRIQYKHEEGHVYTFKLLKIESFENFLDERFKEFNISNSTFYNDYYRQYMISVSEGICDYYSISYFNNSTGENYLNYIEKNKNDYINGFAQHYQGFVFVRYALNNKLYSNLDDLILDIGSIRQYNYYSNFLSVQLV
jgi:hypothetical protein